MRESTRWSSEVIRGHQKVPEREMRL